MDIIYSYLTQLYNAKLLAVAVILIFVSVVDAFVMLRRARISEGRLKSAWAFGGALVFGVGIWALHFIVILAYHPGVSIGFDPTLVCLSLAAAVLCAWVAFSIALFAAPSRRVAYLAGFILGVAGLAMLGVGMASLRLAGILVYRPAWLAGAGITALVTSMAGTVLWWRWQNMWSDLGAAIMIAFGITLMNFFAVNAMRVLPLDIPMTPGLRLDPMNVSILIAGVGLMLTVSLGLIGAQFDAYLYRRLNAEANRTRRLADAAFEGILVHSQGRILEVNRALAALLGRRRRELLGQDFAEMANPPPEHRASLAAELQNPSLQAQEISVTSLDGTIHVVELLSRPLDHNGANATVTAIRDITARKADELRIAYLAYHDQLTGLANRTLFATRLAQAITLADRMDGAMALLTLDLDRFKAVNDTMGHAAGDQIIAQAAMRLRETVRDVDTAARLGGDEFAIIQANISVPDGPLILADRLLASFRQPFQINGEAVSIGISIGIALYPAHAQNSDELLKASDIALYMAKHAGRDCASVFATTAQAVRQNAVTSSS